MRKSNVLVIALLAASSGLFLWMWNYFEFSAVDPADLVITFVWWFVIIGVCAAIEFAEHKRRERMRTLYVADGAIYNPDVGVVRLRETNVQGYIDGMREVLRHMDYSAHTKYSSKKERMRFNYIVYSPKFSQNGKVWSGEVIRVTRPDDPQIFSNEQELALILDTKK